MKIYSKTTYLLHAMLHHFNIPTALLVPRNISITKCTFWSILETLSTEINVSHQNFVKRQPSTTSMWEFELIPRQQQLFVQNAIPWRSKRRFTEVRGRVSTKVENDEEEKSGKCQKRPRTAGLLQICVLFSLVLRLHCDISCEWKE